MRLSAEHDAFIGVLLAGMKRRFGCCGNQYWSETESVPQNSIQITG
jgi:hypothetical protein